MDGSEAARSAFVFVSDWARHFDAQVWFIQLTDESSRRRCEMVSDVSRRGRQLANQFTVSGATRAARNEQLVHGIAEAAQGFQADLIVVGFDRRRFASGVRDQLTVATQVPVLVAPKQTARQADVTTVPKRPTRPVPAIALGPVPSTAAPMADADRLVRV